MNSAVVLKVPSEERYFHIVKSAIDDLVCDIHFSDSDKNALTDATYELFQNTIIHAYPDQKGIVELEFHPFDYGMRINIHDWGMPMAADKYSSVPINLHKDEGFNRIYKLVDRFEYANLGKNGKIFSILKYAKHEMHKETPKSAPDSVLHERMPPDTPIAVRSYMPGDEEAIAKLIYQNYGYSYIKESFYYPRKIRELQNRKIFSIIALDTNLNTIVGHFALVKMPDSNIAEIGVVVVDPRYKGLGIMNKMFQALMDRARELKLDAIFGEAIMYHIFSQKSNLTHGFSETALLLGKAPEEVTIENNELTQKKMRGSVLVGYRLFHYTPQQLTIPEVYKEKILEIYEKAKLHINIQPSPSKPKAQHVHLYYTYDPLMNIATIVIDHYGKHFKHKFLLMLSQLRAKHCDMIYAEINLSDMPQIDKVVKILNRRGFFFAGVLFLKHKNRDYLCLQNKHTTHVGRRNLVCYSDFCKELLHYIRTDEQRIKKNRIK
ncbi:MAG: hypothetical protein DSZ05_08910 [Sulfurospirillum sp.]|nr:MAG: hypothetical protein DSZ05_08910 [Sulfurospirillum sp.]